MTMKTFWCASVLSVVGLFSLHSVFLTQASAQQVQSYMGAHLRDAVFGGSRRFGWYSFPGQQPQLRFHGNDLRITSGDHSTVLLRRDANISGSAAEVSLIHPPVNTSSISGLAVMTDADHALVIGLAEGNVVLWQLDPDATRVIAQQPVNATSPLEFRVIGGDAAQVRFFWRHPHDANWHPLEDSAANTMLASWEGPLHFGLVLDGPQGSQVTFSNYRTGGSQGGPMTAMLRSME